MTNYARQHSSVCVMTKIPKKLCWSFPTKISDKAVFKHLPSEADLRLTRRLSEAARILQIQMLDHVIIGQPMNGRQGYFSFKEAGTIG